MVRGWGRGLCLLLLLFAGTLRAARAQTWNVYNPATAEQGYFNLTLLYQSNQVNGSETQIFPQFLLAYGLRNEVELGLYFGGISMRNAGTRRDTGLWDTTFYAKWRFQEETRHRPQLAIAYQPKFPTSSASRGLGTGAVDHTAYLSAAKSFGRHTFTANLGYNFLGGGDGKNNLFHGVSWAHQTTETLMLMAELYGNTLSATGGTDELAWSAGFNYNFQPDKSVFLQLGRSERGNSDLNVFAGVNFTFK